MSQAWDVIGQKGDGETLRSMSFGSTEERARKNWRDLWGKGFAPRWTEEELTFTPTKGETHAHA